ncbi:MAG: metalloregulator ArsR/SmtB family transcription factor [Terracidiphilus sp.]|jgi:DNA-binding transcriptional ArsR family regulator
MSRRTPNPRSARRRFHAPVFAALGDRTRLALVAKLSHGELHSISQLTQGSRLTRQAITKHLRVLEHAGVVRSMRRGRESLFAFNPEPLEDAKSYLESVSEQWDQTLARLKMFVEEDKPN